MLTTSSTRTRRGGSCLKDIYIYVRPFSSIELACAVRQPSPCVRALCETGVVLHMSHLKLHVTLHTWQSSHFTLHPSQSTLHTSHFTLHSPQSTLHNIRLFPGIQNLQKVCPSITLEHKAYTKHFPVLLCTTKLAESTIPKLRKSADKALSQPRCNHSNTICDVQLQRTIVLRMQPQHRATLTQPLVTTMRSADTELQNTLELRATVSEIAAPKPDLSTPKQKKDDFEALFKRIFKRKISTVKTATIYSQITIAAWMQPLQYDLRCSAAKDNK